MSYCFICAEPNPCEEHKEFMDAQRKANGQDFIQNLEMKEQLTAANKAIVALSEALESARYWMGWRAESHDRQEHLRIETEKVDSAFKTHAPAIEKARGG